MPQAAFVHSLPPLNISLVKLHLNGRFLSHVNITGSVYGPYAKHLPTSMLHTMLKDYMVSLNDHSMIETD